LIIIFIALCAADTCVKNTISNVVPRVDDFGMVIDAHDGNVIFYEGVYLWYAASYGPCKEPSGNTGCADPTPGACGFQFNHNVSVWSSVDLLNWKYGGVVFSATAVKPDSILFCPKVLYNKLTKQFVLWINLVRDQFRTSYYAVATSTDKFGPFSIVEPNVTTLAWPNVGDFNLLVDDSGVGYIIYTAFITGGGPNGADHVMSIDKLAPNYQTSLGKAYNSGQIGRSGVEAPAFFYDKNSKLYIAVFGHCCCYCKEGAPVYAYTSLSPLGPYIQAGSGPIDDDSVSAQQTDIFPFLSENGDMGFMWVGDRWQQSPDGKKSGDPTYWSLLTVFTNGTIGNFQFEKQFDVVVCT